MALRAELAQLKPSIERLVGIEGDIRVLLTQLSRLTEPGARQAETTSATTPPDNTEEVVQPAAANPIKDDIRVLLTQLLQLTDPGAPQAKTTTSTTPPNNNGEAVQPAAATPLPCDPLKRASQQHHPANRNRCAPCN